MIDSEKSLEEILNAMFEKAGNFDGTEDKKELERLKSEPGFRRFKIQNLYDAVFVLTRPPGHHATADMYGGFCIFNNSAFFYLLWL